MVVGVGEVFHMSGSPADLGDKWLRMCDACDDQDMGAGPNAVNQTGVATEDGFQVLIHYP